MPKIYKIDKIGGHVFFNCVTVTITFPMVLVFFQELQEHVRRRTALCCASLLEEM